MTSGFVLFLVGNKLRHFKSVAHAHVGVAKETATIMKEDSKMSEKKTDATVSHDAVKSQIDETNLLTKALTDAVALKTKQLQEELEQTKTERDALQKQNLELRNTIEGDLKADAIVRIMKKGDFKLADLETKKFHELQQIDAILSSAGKGLDPTYKQIRVGNASQSDARGTVGNLYGKSKAEILAMGGDF